MPRKISEIVLFGIDVLLVYLALLFSPAIISIPTTEAYPWPLGIYLSLIFAVAIMLFFGLFSWSKTQRPIQYFLEILKAQTIFILACATGQSYYLTKAMPHPSHIAILWIFLVGAAVLGLCWLRLLEVILLHSGYGIHQVLIYGTGKEAKRICDNLKNSSAFKIVGLLGEKRLKNKFLPYSILGPSDQLRQVLVKYKITDIIIAQQYLTHEFLLAVISECVGLEVSIRQIPDLYDIVSGRVKPYSLSGLPLKDIAVQPLRGYYYTFKRLLDIIFSILGLLILAIIVIFLYFPIRIQSGGSLLYIQRRTGQDGKVFTIYKLRSMYVDAEEETGAIWATKGDPRIFPVGNFIRKTRIDELPQLINVLKGEMSFIGPRPERPSFVNHLAQRIPMYRRRLLVKPGITGWAQVKHKYDETIKDVEEKLKYDLFYIDNLSLWLDIKIFFLTIEVMLTGRGAK